MLRALGCSLVTEDERHFASDEFYVTAADDVASRVHPAFQASGEDMVRRNDYLWWSTDAKRDEARRDRLAQMLAELKAGDRYMKMPYRATD